MSVSASLRAYESKEEILAHVNAPEYVGKADRGEGPGSGNIPKQSDGPSARIRSSIIAAVSFDSASNAQLTADNLKNQKESTRKKKCKTYTDKVHHERVKARRKVNHEFDRKQRAMTAERRRRYFMRKHARCE